MRIQIFAVRAVVFGLALCPLLYSVQAQWVSYPSEGVPRKDGKPDLGAACPRTADGKPDLSGLWIMQTKRQANPDFPGCQCGCGRIYQHCDRPQRRLAVPEVGGRPGQDTSHRATRERSHVALFPNRAHTPAYLEWTQKNGPEPWAADYPE